MGGISGSVAVSQIAFSNCPEVSLKFESPRVLGCETCATDHVANSSTKQKVLMAAQKPSWKPLRGWCQQGVPWQDNVRKGLAAMVLALSGSRNGLEHFGTITRDMSETSETHISIPTGFGTLCI